MTHIIGLAGAARSGKDTAALALVETGWQRKAFADAVREFLYGMNPWLPEDPIDGSYLLAEEVDRYGWEQVKKDHPVVREYLQRCGTEAGRRVLGEDVWVNALVRDYETWDQPTVITDVRFPNEAEAIKQRGGLVVQIVRPGQALIDRSDHISENALADWEFDATILNTSVEGLRASIKALTEPRMR
ncbi:hypothetical protein [Streptomyces luteireticuli]|uniref:deoxynucleotide monophosphate kinase family protein n=1 Tax=Streptomyces luteireticuli TaxID=173858 RepID=UPI003557CBC6